MNTLLHIDTAGPEAILGISRDLQVIASKQNNLSNTHGEFVQAGVEALCKEAGISLKDMDAIAVTMGPGSYTGLVIYLMPIYSALYGYFLFNEKLQSFHWFGGLFVLTGIILANKNLFKFK